jgi:DNA-binding transcriptional ArsR family regulator
MSADAGDLDLLFRALAHPTRRAVVSRLALGPAPVGELAKPFPIALPSFLQHLEMLEDCGLVRSRKVGRVRTYRLRPRPLEEASAWIAAQHSKWEACLDAWSQNTLKRRDDEKAH